MKAIALEILNSFKILRTIFLCLNLFCLECVPSSAQESDIDTDKILEPGYLENFEQEQRERAILEGKFDSSYEENLKKKEEQEKAIKGEYDSIYLENEKRKEENKSVPQGEINDGKETGGLLKSSILLFAVTFAGITIAKSCLKKASSVTFLAAATIYITAEIALFTEFYQDGNKALKAYQQNKYDKRQVGSLEEASKRAKRAADAALAKSIIQSVAAAGFIAAGVIAVIEAALDFPKFTGDCFSTGVFPEAQIQFLAQSLLNALVPNARAKVKFGTIGPLLAGIGVGAAAAVAIGSAMSTTLGSSMAGALGSGYTRGAIFGVFGGFATWSATEAGIAHNKLKKNAKEYKRLAGEASRLKKKGQIIISEEEEIYTREKQSIENVSVGPGKKEEFSPNTCLEGDNIAEDAKADKDCSCRATNTCTKVKLPDLVQDRPDFPGGDTLADAAGAFAKSADAVFSGDLKKAQIEGKNAQRLAARLKTYQSDHIDLANKKIVASGGKPLEDWNKLEAKTEKFLIDKVSASLGSLSSKDRSALAQLAPGLDSNKFSDASADDKPIKIASKNTGEGITGLNGISGTGPIETGFEFLDEKENEERLLLDQNEVKSPRSRGKASNSSKSLGKSDEISDRNKDLFKIVTKRYHSSAYQSFFGRKARAP